MTVSKSSPQVSIFRENRIGRSRDPMKKAPPIPERSL